MSCVKEQLKGEVKKPVVDLKDPLRSLNISGKDIGNMIYTDLLPWSKNGAEETKMFLDQVMNILYEFMHKSNDRSSKILDFHHPDQLMEVLDLSIPDQPQNLDQILVDCKDTLKYQVKTAHPRFFNQLSNGCDTISLAGEFLTSVANANMFTYEIAPVFILLEHVTLKKMRDIIGYENGDSILCPGGTISNMYALLAARYKMFPKIKSEGIRAIPEQLVLFTSEHSHYSIMSAANVTGIGIDNCIEVPCDNAGHMLPEELERLVKEALKCGKKPFFVNATAGTTVFGAFDPLNAIADICEKYGLWMHVDAAWGGGLLLSKKYKNLRFKGVERADSVTWNPHKLMGVLLQCSTVHFKENGLLYQCNRLGADYLFQQDKHYDISYDTGDKVIQCGRHNDIFKLWLAWRAKGTEGYGKQMDRFMELTEYMIKKLNAQPDKFWIIVPKPECTNVCFWYIPERLRKMPHSQEKERLLGQITPILKGKMMNSGTLMIGYQPQGKLPNFFRNIISNQAVREEDIDFLVDELDRLGKDL
ncbi:glutamate decarboxylase-like [Artemia franciscana]|uniref:Glutamate decarboxylase n=1 Tax=Artemia franciscana TaxID=6661 RepID=A0AA88I8F7_ARTSF|nr:hypothetical protein QYM36_000550 [Artemia franciscana]